MGSDAQVMADGGAQVADSSLIKQPPSCPANPTLYLSNIDWSIKKALLKRSLLALFSRHGKVLEIICLRGNGGSGKPLRGQAWVIFESVSVATAALQAERGFVFFGRPLMVNYAKEVSDRIAKRDGTFNVKTTEQRKEKRKLENASSSPNKMVKINEEGGVTSVNDPSSLVGGQQSSAPPPPPTAESLESTSPTALLLSKNLPSECNEMMLQMLFRQYAGYKEVKMVGEGNATIEFGSEDEATSALKGLNGFKLTTESTLDLGYAKQ